MVFHMPFNDGDESGMRGASAEAILTKLGEFQFSTTTGEGWGMTFDGEHIIVSDGSEYLHFWEPEAVLRAAATPASDAAAAPPAVVSHVKRLRVNWADGRPVSKLNELEYVCGYIFANVWHMDAIIRIDPTTGSVVATTELKGLFGSAA